MVVNMRGLLNRATAIHEQIFEIESIPKTERDRIYEEIDEAISGGKLVISDETLLFKSRKNDKKLLLIVNCTALFLMISIGLTLYFYLGNVEKQIISGSNTLNLTENQIITALREESEVKLSEKEKEIIRIQTQMNNLLDKQSLLLITSNERIKQLEEKLRGKINSELQLEQLKLQDMELSAANMEQEMNKLESRMESAYQKELLLIKENEEEERLIKEKELQDRMAQYQQSLFQAQEEQEILADSLNKQIDELETSYKSDRDAALLEYNNMMSLNQNEQILLTRISKLYSEISEHISNGNNPAASEIIIELRQFIQKEELTVYPNINSRKHSDLLLLQTLSGLLSSYQAPLEDVEPAYEIDEINRYINEGNIMFTTRQYAGAKKSYLSAISMIPAMEQGYSKIQEIEAIDYKSREDQFIDFLNSGDEAYEKGLYSDSMENYHTALLSLTEQDEEITSMLENLSLMGRSSAMEEMQSDLLSDEERRILAEADKMFKNRDVLLSRLNMMEVVLMEWENTDNRSGEDELVDLLNTKVLLKEVMSSKSVRDIYPDLHNTLETYLDHYGLVQQNNGKSLVINDISLMISSLNKENQRPPEPADEIQKDLYLSMLGSIKKLLK
jgi:hypothetical protein